MFPLVTLVISTSSSLSDWSSDSSLSLLSMSDRSWTLLSSSLQVKSCGLEEVQVVDWFKEFDLELWHSVNGVVMGWDALVVLMLISFSLWGFPLQLLQIHVLLLLLGILLQLRQPKWKNFPFRQSLLWHSRSLSPDFGLELQILAPCLVQTLTGRDEKLEFRSLCDRTWLT